MLNIYKVFSLFFNTGKLFSFFRYSKFSFFYLFLIFVLLVFFIFGFLIFLKLYFLPYRIAKNKRRRSFEVFLILIFNLFSGWTIIGWFSAIIWAKSLDDLD